MGEHDSSDFSEELLDRKKIAIKRVIVHEDYNWFKPNGNPDKDITILELAEEVDLTTYTPACMAKTEDKTFDDEKAWAYGRS